MLPPTARNMNPYAYSPRLAGTSQTEHKLVTAHPVLTTTPTQIYVAPESLTVRFMNCLFCNVTAAPVPIYMDHWDEVDQAFTFLIHGYPVPNAAEPYLFEGGHDVMQALHEKDYIRIWADTADAVHAHLTVEENHARLLG